MPYIKLTDRALYVNLIYDDGKLIYHFLCIFIREFIRGLGICFTRTPMAPLFFLFREFINGTNVSFSFSRNFIIRINHILCPVLLQFRKTFLPHSCEYHAI